MRTWLIALTVAVLVVTASVGAYLTLYLPSQRPILVGAKPVPAEQQQMIPVTPLAEVEVPDAVRADAAETLRAAAQSLEPGSRIDEQQMFSHPGGWFPLQKLTSEHFAQFGMRKQADAEMTFDGHPFQYLIWGPGWPRDQFDDRVVVAVRYYAPLAPDYPDNMLGFFVMSPS